MSGYMLQTADAVAQNPWKFCLICSHKQTFSSATEFKNHLRNVHCSKEGGSYVCRYGRNNVCPSLPMEGVDEQDYVNHVERVHINLDGRADNIAVVEDNKISERSPSPPPQATITVERIPVYKYKDDYLHETDKTGWICHPCQNLTAVLNDPRTSRRQVDFFTKQWGESFVPQLVAPLPLLGTVPKSYFEDFTKKFEFKQMQHEKLKKLTLQPHAIRKSQQLKNKSENAAASSDDSPPEIFFKQNFNLEDPTIFKEVFPWSNIQQSTGKKQSYSKRKKSSKLLQEKLTHYLDVTEVKLAQQIATKSEDFFGAMRTQEKLEGEVQVSCQNVKQLRLRLKEIRSKLVGDPLQVMQLFRLRHRYEAVLEKINLMATVHQTQPTIQLLLKNADFVSALDLIDTSLEVLTQELAGIQCFRHLGSQLSEMAKAIERMMQADFLDFAINILNQPHTDDQHSLYKEDRLLSVVLGLIRQKKLKFLHLYKTECFAVIKNTIKQTAHSALLEDSETSDIDHSGKFGDYIRSLAHDEWLVVLESCFCVILQILKNMGVIHEGLVRVFTLATGIQQETEENKGDDYLFVVNNMNTLLHKSECEKLTEESKEILGSAFELIQTTCSKVITMRAKGGALDSLSSNEFVDLARTVEQFASDCETICGRQSHHLRGTLLSQAKKFVEKFHEERKHKLSNILDIERWSQADVPSEIQDMVSSVNITNGFQKVKTPTKSYNTEADQKSFLLVQGQRFAVVGTLLMLMRMIFEYCQCVVDVPMLVTDLLTKICEILKLFNSRSCQIVLGAGALQTIGLKRISAKHLALVAQCLEVVILHIHIIKNHFEVRIEPKQYVLLHQFDQILKDYSNHRHELICKIVSLMEGIFQAHLENYTVRPPMPSKAMREIVKQILKLRESLEEVMPSQQLESFFRDIRRCFKDCFAEKLAQLKVINDGRPQHGMVTTDINHFVSNLKQYKGFNDLTNKFDDLWITVRQNLEKQSQENKNDVFTDSKPKPTKFPHR